MGGCLGGGVRMAVEFMLRDGLYFLPRRLTLGSSPYAYPGPLAYPGEHRPWIVTVWVWR